MHTTPPSLLERLRYPAGEDAWNQFVALYTPLLCMWARRLGETGADVDDVVQDVFAILVKKLPEFQYNPQQRFRGWLWTVLVNKVRAGRRQRVAVVPLDPHADVTDSHGSEEAEEAEYRQYLVQRTLELIHGEFQPTTWQAFQALALGEEPAAVAVKVGLSVPSVYAAKSRVLRRLRQELEGMLD
jgi:RNA polymerase sigma-70 factor, ECF subfamily